MKHLTLLLTILSIAFTSISQTQCGYDHIMMEAIEADSTLARSILPGITHARSSFEQKTISVIVHIFYEGEVYGEGSHLTQEVVIEAIDHLNQVYAGLTEEDNNTFIDFCISGQDSVGNEMSGILYHDLNDYPLYTGAIGNIINGQFYLGLRNTYAYDVNNYMEIFVAPWTTGSSGFSSGPPSNIGVWVRTNRFGFGSHVTNASNQNTTLSHEVGHWSGLFHTFANIYTNDMGTYYNSYSSCEEAQSETDCVFEGDRVCDTEPTTSIFSCSSACGENPTNMMGYYPGTCRSGFTIGQIERMHSTLEIFRPQHLQNDACPLCDDFNNNYVCDEDETGCTDLSACNYDELMYYDDGSCEYAESGYDCEGNLLVSVQELYQQGIIKSYTYYDINGRVVDEMFNISGIYMLVVERFDGTYSVTKEFIDIK